MPLHPDRTFDSPTPTPRDPLGAVEAFARRLVVTLESDYGDWMREANLAWHELCRSLSPMKPRIAHLVGELHEIIQFNPTWHPIETCRHAVTLANQIRRELGVSSPMDLHRLGLGLTEPETPLAEFEIESPFPHHRVPEHFANKAVPT